MRRAWLSTPVAVLLLSAPARSDPGREFFAVYSYRAGNLMPLSILACNPDPIVPATVIVETELSVVGGGTVAPGGCEVVLVSNERKASATIEERLAYRVSSDRPILVQQYADYAVQSGYPSAARLPDTAELGTEYMVLAMRAGNRDTEPSVLTVVAPRTARVSVTVTADTQAAGITPALAAGATYTTDLPAFGVLQLASVPDADLTGSIVRSDVPVQVLGGCITCFVSISATADGMQEVMPPLATWGRRYVVPASYPTTTAQNLIRILARDDATVVSTDPPQSGTPVTMDRGGFFDVVTTSDFVVDASAPVLVGRVEGRGPGAYGDPALVLLLSEEQFITAATFSLPDDWDQLEEWVDIVTDANTKLVVDGSPVPAASLVPVGSSGFAHASLRLAFGRTHSVSGDRPFAAYASARHGYNAVSYAVDVGCGSPSPPEISRARTPLLLVRRGSDVLFSWEDVGSAPVLYNAYAGTIGTIWDHTALACGVVGTPVGGGRREATLTVPSSGYFLLSAASCGGEGATGGDPSRSDCPP